MSPRHSAIAGVIALTITSLSSAETKLDPPVANRVDHREVRHGATVVDPYFWLRRKIES